MCNFTIIGMMCVSRCAGSDDFIHPSSRITFNCEKGLLGEIHCKNQCIVYISMTINSLYQFTLLISIKSFKEVSS